MSKSDDKSKDDASGVYLTLISMMQSLALGYLLQLLGAELIAKGTLPLNMVFQATTALLVIILVWHQYAMGVIQYSWKLDIFDSILPFFMGITEYSLIASMAIPETNTALGDIRYNLWLWSLAAFAFVSIFAYWNQFGKTDPEPKMKALIAVSKRSMLQTIGYFLFFALLASALSIWRLAGRFNCILSLIITLSFLAELIRVEWTNTCLRRQEGQN